MKGWIHRALIAALVLSIIGLAACSNPLSSSSDQTRGSNQSINTKFLTGSGPPTSSQGSDGDLYLDTSAEVLYVKTDGSWVNVASLKGPGWSVAAGVPGVSLGSDGDLYLDTATSQVYEKENGSWSPLFKLQGPAGAPGTIWHVGQGNPNEAANAPASYNDGDMYLDLLSTMVYQASGTSWNKVAAFQQKEADFVFTPAFLNFMNAVAYGDGTFVAVGDSGVIVRTTGGTNWDYGTIIPPQPEIVALSAAQARGSSTVGGRFARSATDHARALARARAFRPLAPAAARGINPNGVENPSYDLYAVAYDGRGTFVAVGDNTILTSIDGGQTWNSADFGDVSGNYFFYGVTYASGKFVVVGEINGDTADGTVFEGTPSGAGYEWSEQTPDAEATGVDLTNRPLYCVTSDGKTIVAGGNDVLIADDGSGWTEVTPSTEGGGTNYVSGFGTIDGITYGNGKFIAVGYNQQSGTTILTSAGSVSSSSWSSQDVPLSAELYGIAYGSGGFVAVGVRSKLLTSTNGVSWKLQDWSDGLSSPPDFYGISWGDLAGGLYAIAVYGNPIAAE